MVRRRHAFSELGISASPHARCDHRRKRPPHNEHPRRCSLIRRAPTRTTTWPVRLQITRRSGFLRRLPGRRRKLHTSCERVDVAPPPSDSSPTHTSPVRSTEKSVRRGVGGGNGRRVGGGWLRGWHTGVCLISGLKPLSRSAARQRAQRGRPEERSGRGNRTHRYAQRPRGVPRLSARRRFARPNFGRRFFSQTPFMFAVATKCWI